MKVIEKNDIFYVHYTFSLNLHIFDIIKRNFHVNRPLAYIYKLAYSFISKRYYEKKQKCFAVYKLL
jgi:hypothetical protein